MHFFIPHTQGITTLQSNVVIRFIYDDTSAPFATGQGSCIPRDGYVKMDSFNIIIFGGSGDCSRGMLMLSLVHVGAFNGVPGTHSLR